MADDRAPEKRTGGKPMPEREGKSEHLKDVPAKDGVDEEGNVKGGAGQLGYLGGPLPKQ